MNTDAQGLQWWNQRATGLEQVLSRHPALHCSPRQNQPCLWQMTFIYSSSEDSCFLRQSIQKPRSPTGKRICQPESSLLLFQMIISTVDLENTLLVFVLQPQSSLLWNRWLRFVHYFLIGLAVRNLSSIFSLSCIHISEGASQNWTQPIEGWVHHVRYACPLWDENLISQQLLISPLCWWMYGVRADELFLQNCSIASFSTLSLSTCLFLLTFTTMCLSLLNCTPSFFRLLFCDHFDLAYSLLKSEVPVNADNSENQKLHEKASSPLLLYGLSAFILVKFPLLHQALVTVSLHLSW